MSDELPDPEVEALLDAGDPVAARALVEARGAGVMGSLDPTRLWDGTGTYRITKRYVTWDAHGPLESDDRQEWTRMERVEE